MDTGYDSPMDHVELHKPPVHRVQLQQNTKEERKVVHSSHQHVFVVEQKKHGTHVTVLPTCTSLLITVNDVGRIYGFMTRRCSLQSTQVTRGEAVTVVWQTAGANCVNTSRPPLKKVNQASFGGGPAG